MSSTPSPSLLDHLSLAVVLLAPDATIRYLNQAAASVLGRSSQRLLGACFLDLLVNSEPLKEALQHVRTGQTLSHHDCHWQLTEAPPITLDYHLSLKDDLLLLEFQLRDRVLELDANARSQSKQVTHKLLAQSLAHEIKNPLGGIRGAAQLLEMEQKDPAVSEYTQVIIQEVDRLNRLVDRMLGPRQALRLESVNIHQLLERVCLLLAQEAEFSPLDIKRDYDPSLPELEGDAEQLLQVLLNLGRNACQALVRSSVEQPQLRLRTRILRQVTIAQQRHRLACLVEIEDNGPGIPEALKERLFYPMISGHAKGSGLGLCLAQGITQQHQGTLCCQSEPGRCCFSMTLPFSQRSETRHD